MRVLLELVVTLGPALLMAALLLARCFPGETRILRHRLRTGVRRLRAPKIRFPRRAASARVAVVARGPRCLRGPPVVA